MILMNLLVGLPMMLLCVLFQAGAAIWSVRHFVRRSARAGKDAGFLGATRPLLTGMLIMTAGNLAQIVA